MVAFLDEVIANIDTYRALARTELTGFYSNLSDAAYHFKFTSPYNGGIYLGLAAINIQTFLGRAYGSNNSVWAFTIDALELISANWPEETVAVDMDSILSAMVTAEPDQVQYFVGLVDAYRQSIWDRPFNKEFFASLARGFEQWP